MLIFVGILFTVFLNIFKFILLVSMFVFSPKLSWIDAILTMSLIIESVEEYASITFFMVSIKIGLLGFIQISPTFSTLFVGSLEIEELDFK